MVVEAKSLIHHKLIKFQNVKVSTKLWMVKIGLPFVNIQSEKVAAGNKLVWVIRKVLN
jgi:hypothetical protein